MARRFPKNENYPFKAGRAVRSCFAALLAFGGVLAAPMMGQAQSEPAPAEGVPLLAAQPAPPGPPLSGPNVTAASAIIVDAATGTILWEKAAHTRRPIASTTKIMTAALMIESGQLDDEVAFSKNAMATPYANLNARPGEKFKMLDLLYAVMLRSSNDSCVAVGEHLYGSAAAFAQAMTAKARAIGATNTNFVTTNGLYHKDHYSTAYDLALMTRYAFQYPLFNEVAGTKSLRINRTVNTKDPLLRNHNKFLSRYEGADGVKTGYVRQSGRCLVASATTMENDQPWRLITVALNSPDTYGDSAKMMDWARKTFQPVFIARKGESLGVVEVRGGVQKKVPLVAGSDIVAIARRAGGNDIQREVRVVGELRAPVQQSQKGGQVVALVDGQPVATADLVAAASIEQAWVANISPFTPWSLVLATVFMGYRWYARAVAESSLRRRRRLEARRRALYSDWESIR